MAHGPSVFAAHSPHGLRELHVPNRTKSRSTRERGSGEPLREPATKTNLVSASRCQPSHLALHIRYLSLLPCGDLLAKEAVLQPHHGSRRADGETLREPALNRPGSGAIPKSASREGAGLDRAGPIWVVTAGLNRHSSRRNSQLRWRSSIATTTYGRSRPLGPLIRRSTCTQSIVQVGGPPDSWKGDLDSGLNGFRWFMNASTATMR